MFIFFSDIKLSCHTLLVDEHIKGILEAAESKLSVAKRCDLAAAETPQSVFLSTKLNFNSTRLCRLIRR